MRGGFERWVAESLPGRGQQHHVAGGVRLSDGQPRLPTVAALALAAALASVAVAAPKNNGTRRVGHQAVELGAVAVFGRTEKPVRPAHRSGQLEPARDVLAQKGPRGLEEESGFDVHAKSARVPVCGWLWLDAGRKSCRSSWR